MSSIPNWLTAFLLALVLTLLGILIAPYTHAAPMPHLTNARIAACMTQSMHASKVRSFEAARRLPIGFPARIVQKAKEPAIPFPLPKGGSIWSGCKEVLLAAQAAPPMHTKAVSPVTASQEIATVRIPAPVIASSPQLAAPTIDQPAMRAPSVAHAKSTKLFGMYPHATTVAFAADAPATITVHVAPGNISTETMTSFAWWQALENFLLQLVGLVFVLTLAIYASVRLLMYLSESFVYARTRTTNKTPPAGTTQDTATGHGEEAPQHQSPEYSARPSDDSPRSGQQTE